jgi:hypothetical protein
MNKKEKVTVELSREDWEKVFVLLQEVDEHIASGSPIDPVFASHPDYIQAYHLIRKAAGCATNEAMIAEYYRQKALGIEHPSFKEEDLIDK